MSKVTIRPLRADDRDDWRRMWTGYLDFYRTSVDEAVYTAYFERLLGDDPRDFSGLVAFVDGVPAGLAHYLFHRHGWKLRDVCYLQDLWAEPDVPWHRRRRRADPRRLRGRRHRRRPRRLVADRRGQRHRPPPLRPDRQGQPVHPVRPRMRRRALLFALAVASCTTAGSQTERAAATPVGLPPMKAFSAPRAAPAARSNVEIARDFMDLSFQLESGRQIQTFTRFEQPITVRLTGNAPAALSGDLDRLLARLRAEARLDIRRVPASQPASITVETVPHAAMRRAVPQAACFVVPRMQSWDEFRRNRRSPDLDWTTLTERTRAVVFIPSDEAPQEMRDCLHEELAQALGPLNDLYRLTDSVFNDDNFHTVLTGFDMLILRATYAPELASGMSRRQVDERLPGVLDRINPAGRVAPGPTPGDAPRAWIEAIEAALGPRGSDAARVAAAKRAVGIARSQGWQDNRLAFALYALGRLSLPTEPELALASFLESADLYHRDPATRLQEAHVAMQLAAFALAAGDPDAVLRIVEPQLEPARRGENAALLASLLLMQAEALDLAGDPAEARTVRAESLGWARYGFGTEEVVRARAAEIASLAPPPSG